jgi:hypothetical protein
MLTASINLVVSQLALIFFASVTFSFFGDPTDFLRGTSFEGFKTLANLRRPTLIGDLDDGWGLF